MTKNQTTEATGQRHIHEETHQLRSRNPQDADTNTHKGKEDCFTQQGRRTQVRAIKSSTDNETQMWKSRGDKKGGKYRNRK